MIVVTGASDGLGLQVAKLYKEAGKKVVNISRRESEFADENILVDLREGSEIEKASKAVAGMQESLEAIINCAGVFSSQPLGEITEDEIKRVMATNVKAAMLLVSNLIDRIKQDGTDIVNVTSSASLKGTPDQAVYGASKWAMRGFSASLQTDLKATKSRVISFCPGGMYTEFFKKTNGDDAPDNATWMSPPDVARCLKQLLDLPKSIEVSEIILNRKSA